MTTGRCSLVGGRRPTVSTPLRGLPAANGSAPARSSSRRWTANGTEAGYDLELTAGIADSVRVPVIASGGVGELAHLVEGAVLGHADGLLAASIFHFGRHTVAEAKEQLSAAGVTVRPPGA